MEDDESSESVDSSSQSSEQSLRSTFQRSRTLERGTQCMFIAVWRAYIVYLDTPIR